MAMFIGPRMIAALNRYQIGQQVRTDGPLSHLQKSGTPTMGGGLILVSMVFGTLLWADLSSRFIWVLVGATSAFAASASTTGSFSPLRAPQAWHDPVFRLLL